MSTSTYGVSTYGEALYGGDNLVAGVNYWFLEVQWNGTDWVSEGAYITPDSLNIERGREQKINANGQGFIEMQPGKMSAKLRNDEGRYDARNTSSALYPYVAPGKKIRLTYQKGIIGDRLPVFTGLVDNIEPQTMGGVEVVTLTAYDGLAKLKDQEANVTLTEGIGTGDAIQDVLDYVSWDGGTSLDAGADTIGYWWVDQQKAANAIYDLAFSEIGEFFIARDGTATYYGRHHTSAVEVNLTGDTVKEPYVRQPWNIVKNVIRLSLTPRVLRALGDVWTLQGDLFIKAGESATVWATYTYDNRYVPCKNVVCVSGTDYSANSASDESGSDLTAGFSVSLYSFGKAGKLVFTNGGATDGYVFSKVRGEAIDAPDDLTIEESAGTGSAIFTANMIWQQDTNTAIDLAKFLAEQLSQDSFYPVVTIETDAEEQVGIELFDKINLVLPNYGISNDFKVGKIRHQVTGGGGGVLTTTLWLEPPVEDLSNYWSFPTEIGISSYFAY